MAYSAETHLHDAIVRVLDLEYRPNSMGYAVDSLIEDLNRHTGTAHLTQNPNLRTGLTQAYATGQETFARFLGSLEV